MFFVGGPLLLHLPAEHRRLDGHGVLRAGRGGDDPALVPRKQLLAANGIFTLTLNAAFALGFALLGPLVVKIAGRAGADRPRRGPVLRRRRVLLRPCRPLRRPARRRADGRPRPGPRGRACGRVRLRPAARGPRLHPGATRDPLVADLPRDRRVAHRRPGRARARTSRRTTLGLGPEDFVVVVLPLGIGIVMGVLLLNAYGRLLPRRRVIEGGLVALGHPAGDDPVRPDQPVPERRRRPDAASTCRS